MELSPHAAECAERVAPGHSAQAHEITCRCAEQYSKTATKSLASEAVRGAPKTLQRAVAGYLWGLRCSDFLSSIQHCLGVKGSGLYPASFAQINAYEGLSKLSGTLLRKKLEWNEQHLLDLIGYALPRRVDDFAQLPWISLLSQLEKLVGDDPPREAVRVRLLAIQSRFRSRHLRGEFRKENLRIDAILAAGTSSLPIAQADAWTARLIGHYDLYPPSEQEAWRELLDHLGTTRSSKPGQRFLKRAGELIQSIGRETYQQVLVSVLDAAGTAYQEFDEQRANETNLYEATLINPDYADFLRGMIWTAGVVWSQDVCDAVGRAGDRCTQKVAYVGPRNTKIGNACVWCLASHGGADGISEVNRLLGRVKHASVRKQIESTLNRAAEKQGLSRDDLDDLAVPTCGLNAIGMRNEAFGEYAAELTVVSGTATQTVWRTPAGKQQKTLPKAVKEGFADRVKAWKADEKRLKQALQAHRDRMERVFIRPRVWSYADWTQRIVSHPLMGWLARRLIWSFRCGDTVVAGAWHEDTGRWVDASETSIEPWLNQGEVEVGLWHPVDATAEAVQAWRAWLMRNEITQPIKQAHREVYLLTDAERETNTYSNRFAAHIIRQHQLLALCQSRGWTYRLMGGWDGVNAPFRVLPGWDLRAEFVVDYSGDNSTSDTGVLLLMSTDQIRFYECDPNEPADTYDQGRPPLPLEQVPPRVLSEVMRDVDLFVAVAGIGADPDWLDHGDGGLYNEYWHDVSFGELNHTAATRKQVLERLVPRLKIADRCSFSDKFLVVKGGKRTYKIHLGSGNILMEPNDQYLCIVPGRGAVKGEAGKVFLPFEGDRTLSIILSKAFMLAEDTKITDPTILSQIG